MNKLRLFCAGLLLTLALTASTFAGQIECPGVVEPPPQTTVENTTPTDVTEMGEMQNGVTDSLIWLILSLF